jgi:hypothetical protein
VVMPGEALPSAVREINLDSLIGEYFCHSHSLLPGLRASGTVERRVANLRQGIDFQGHFTHAHGYLRCEGRVALIPFPWVSVSKETGQGSPSLIQGGFERSLVQQNSTRRCAAREWFMLLFDR